MTAEAARFQRRATVSSRQGGVRRSSLTLGISRRSSLSHVESRRASRDVGCGSAVHLPRSNSLWNSIALSSRRAAELNVDSYTPNRRSAATYVSSRSRTELAASS